MTCIRDSLRSRQSKTCPQVENDVRVVAGRRICRRDARVDAVIADVAPILVVDGDIGGVVTRVHRRVDISRVEIIRSGRIGSDLIIGRETDVDEGMRGSVGEHNAAARSEVGGQPRSCL